MSKCDNNHDLSVHINPSIVVLSIVVAFMGSFVSITLYDQYRLCSKENKPKLFNPNTLLFLMACSLGGIAIWCMHFIGMASIKLKNCQLDTISIHYRVDLTIISLICAIVACYIGLLICARDKSFTKDKNDQINEYINELKSQTIHQIRNIKGKHKLIIESLFVNSHLLAFGGLCAATGVCVMHYIGMQAMVFKGHIVWSPGIIAASVIIALVAATAAFWILFRLLALYPNVEILRIGSSIVMSIAVNGVHYTGMKAADFRYYEKGYEKYAKSNLISQESALTIAIVVGILLVFILLSAALADIRSWYYNLQSIVQIADAQARIYQTGQQEGEYMNQPFVQDWLELRDNNISEGSFLTIDSQSASRVRRVRSVQISHQIVPIIDDKLLDKVNELKVNTNELPATVEQSEKLIYNMDYDNENAI